MKIIFIIVDAMRWDYLSSNGYPRPTTPNLDKIANSSCVFDRAYAVINQTDMSLTSIFSGYYPVTHGLQQTAAATPLEKLNTLNVWKIHYLAQYLNDAGYKTLGVDWLDRWHRWGYDWYFGLDEKQGLRRFRKLAQTFPKLAILISRQLRRRGGKWSALVRSKPSINARVATDKALDMLKQNPDSDLFLMIHYWDTHAPYAQYEEYLDEMNTITLPGEDQDLGTLVDDLCHTKEYKDWALNDVVLDNKTTGDLIRKYCACLRYVDEQIGRVTSYLEEKGLFDETMLIITADHGENIFEHGYFIEHSGVPENVMHVPLIMHFPGIEASQTKETVNHVDLLPTILDYLGLETEGEMDGWSLIPFMSTGQPLNREQIFFQSRLEQGQWGIIRGGRYKYTERREEYRNPCPHCGGVHPPMTELYDLGEDPMESHNLVATRPGLCTEMRNRLRQMTQAMMEKKQRLTEHLGGKTGPGYTVKEQTELERRLRDLGYID